MVSGIAANGPRLTFMSLNGPFSIQPPPLPAGLRPLLWWVVLMPWPDMLVSEPSKIGEVSGLVAHLPQSQYYTNMLAWYYWVEDRLGCMYGLSSVISTLGPKGLLIRPGVVSVP